MANKDNEIDLVIEENGVLYPVEIKMTGNPRADMTSANVVLDKVVDKERGKGTIICLTEKKMHLSEHVIALPIDYV